MDDQPVATLITPATGYSPDSRRRPPRLAPGWRKLVVLVHIVGSVGWLGMTATFVVLTLSLLGVRDAATLRAGYGVHELMVAWLARPAALLTLGSGLLLSFGTKWGLTRYWWVLAKLVLLVATVAVTVSISPELLGYAVQHADAAGTPTYTQAQHTLVLMTLYHVLMIGAATASRSTNPEPGYAGAPLPVPTACPGDQPKRGGRPVPNEPAALGFPNSTAERLAGWRTALLSSSGAPERPTGHRRRCRS